VLASASGALAQNMIGNGIPAGVQPRYDCAYGVPCRGADEYVVAQWRRHYGYHQQYRETPAFGPGPYLLGNGP